MRFKYKNVASLCKFYFRIEYLAGCIAWDGIMIHQINRGNQITIEALEVNFTHLKERMTFWVEGNEELRKHCPSIQVSPYKHLCNQLQ